MTSQRVAFVNLVALILLASCGSGDGSTPTGAVKTFTMPSGSMEPTIPAGEPFEATEVKDYEARRGDVIVFAAPGGWIGREPGGLLVIRVIGVGGDSVVCCNDEGRQTVNDEPLDEPYIAEGEVPSLIDFDVTVPDGFIWVEGDNRSNSADSRVHLGDPGGGFVPVEAVEALFVGG